MTNEDIIEAAEKTLKSKMVGDRLFGNVGATLITDSGNSYSGVCIDTGSGTGFCAEASAIAAMVTAGEYKIKKIVAVWKDENGDLYVLPPCGRCRLFIQQMDKDNINTEVVLGKATSHRLSELLPYTDWPKRLRDET
jgi:cytidine deaminase